jgi:hypothetical protein
VQSPTGQSIPETMPMQRVKAGIMELLCKCGNMLRVHVDSFGVYYCDVCEQYHEVDTDD